MSDSYRQMWEDFGKEKAERYNQLKFFPVNRVGLTNYIREEAFLKTILSVEHGTVLDIGCASGRQVFRLAPQCKRVVGVDIAQSFIDECNKQKEILGIENAEFAVATFDELPQEEFDVVFCGEVLEHVIDLNADVEAIRSRTKIGGHAVITVPHFNADGTLWGRISRLLKLRRFVPLEHFSADEIKKHGDAHIREFSRERLSKLFRDHGFATVSIRTVSHLDGPWGDKILSGFLERMPWTRPILIWKEHVLQTLFPGLGRHIVLLARRES